MRLTADQWRLLEPLIPRPRIRKDGKGRPWKDTRQVLEGILWVLKSGARWCDLPKDYAPYQTCHRRFQDWCVSGVMRKVIQGLVRHLEKDAGINLTETYIDATFVKAKKKLKKLATPKQAKAHKSWPYATVGLFLSAYPLRVLHHMRVSLLEKQFGVVIHETNLSELWVTKLTIATLSMRSLQKEIESNLLLPISQIESLRELRMDELLEDTENDGKWNDSFPG